MNAREVELTGLVRSMVRAANLGCEVRVIVQDAAPAEPDVEECYAVTESVRSSSAFSLTVYSAFFTQPEVEQRTILAHELGHMVVWPYQTTANRVAKRKADKEHLEELEEDLADRIGRLILSACYEAGVDFEALSRSPSPA
jgi:hypothetical protein